jgi:hypothetical protein
VEILFNFQQILRRSQFRERFAVQFDCEDCLTANIGDLLFRNQGIRYNGALGALYA